MSSDDIDVKNAIRELDNFLIKSGNCIYFIPAGGAALIFLG